VDHYFFCSYVFDGTPPKLKKEHMIAERYNVLLPLIVPTIFGLVYFILAQIRPLCFSEIWREKKQPKSLEIVQAWPFSSSVNTMCWEIATPNLGTDFCEVVPKYFDTTSSMDPIPTLHQEDLHLNTIMRDQLYTRTQLFIHHNLVQHMTIALFIWLSYHDTATLPSPTWDLLCHGRGGEYPYL